MEATILTPQSVRSKNERCVDSFAWPHKVNLLGLQMTPTTYEEASESVIKAAECGAAGVVSCHAVHAIVTLSATAERRRKANTFAMITPDGQPVRWALNLLHGTQLKDRVYGPQLTLEICRKAAECGVSIYLYGGSPAVVEVLADNLKSRFPGLQIAGYESPPFRELSVEEDAEVVNRINGSGAGIVFIGLGCPKQDLFAFDHMDQIDGVQVCVGAAFDFHAGAKAVAPPWMQRIGLEWLFRLVQEPGRLWKRYLHTNSVFVAKVLAQAVNIPRVILQRRRFAEHRSDATDSRRRFRD